MVTRLSDFIFLIAALPFHREEAVRATGRWQTDKMCRRGG